VTAATAYDDPKTGITYILILGQSIYMGDRMNTSLLCPNQLRTNNIMVDDIPKHLAPQSKPSTHSIICSNEDMILPLSLKGVISYIDTRTPSQEELDTCKWITLTNEHDWDPHSEFFQEQENNFDALQDRHHRHNERQIYSVLSEYNQSRLHETIYKQLSDAYDDNSYITLQVATTMTSKRGLNMNAETLSNNWCIGLEAAKKTLQVTTQKGIRNVLHPYPIEKRFRTKQAQFRYKQLSGRHGRFYTDTFFSNTPSINGCKMAQLYINDLTFTKVYPMKTKSQTSETLSAFIHDVGIPTIIHSDDANELMHGKFRQLCKDYSITSTFTEPYSPWQNRAEGGIREIK
jgi:hypothetical protein